MRDLPGEPLRVANVRLALCVSRRELEYAFRATLDASPQEYLHQLRLDEIHRTLLCGDAATTSVTPVTIDHGITHLGRFAAEYGRLSGEKPGETARVAERAAERQAPRPLLSV